MISGYLGLLAAVFMASSCGYAAYVLAMRLAPAAGVSVRCCAAVLSAAWLQVAVFEVLISLHAFDFWAALAVWPLLAIVLHLGLTDPEHRPRRQAVADWQQLRQAVRIGRFHGAGVVVTLTALLSTATLLRGLVVPPLAWDSLTYQFLKPATWVQTAAMITQPAPDAWSYYAYFPYTGNVFWAWGMLPMHGELLLAPMGFAIWLSMQLAVYTAARLLGARPITAVLAAVTLGVTPATFAYVISGYVDNTLAAAFLLGIVFLIRTFTGHRREATLAAAGFGLAAGVKLSGAVMLGLAGTVLAIYLFRKRSSLRQWLGAMAGVWAAAMVGVMPYLRTCAETGSPLYPKGLRLFGFEVLQGNEQLAAVLSGEIFGEAARFSELSFLWITLVPRWQFTGLGPVAPVLVGAGLVGLVLLLRPAELRTPAALMLVCSAATVALLFAPDACGVRTHWPSSCARFLLPAFACCVVWAATLRRVPKWPWYAAIGFGLMMGLPRNWSVADARAVGVAAACLAAGLAVAVLPAAWLCWRVGRPKLGAALALLLAGVCLLPLRAVGEHYRWAIYRAADARRSWTVHHLQGEYTSSWPIWRYFDGVEGDNLWEATLSAIANYWALSPSETPPTSLGAGHGGHRIAVTAGWERAGHNWYRYPLLGSRLQNELLYVPITEDGQIINYRGLERHADRADFIAWLNRLVDRRVGYVVCLAPDNTLESLWARQHPEFFQPLVESIDGQSRAYRFRRPAARLRLARR